eukprot:CAMPEP_0179091596 /NCGR_PEP_ID=MMETSP0796-20121207/41852_1 /TAXON_ID=73915 /ORGANISM="Pyrodinium bahamense, Strain pbaha01" /LENGTH=649 /DNA_ID=CAMNT_0020789193 /DNA_START=203 /DNA_END=2150 /DNA_ORIENTATION=-
MVLTLGPSFIVLATFYKRYEYSTSQLQVAYTFCEAILWIIPLMLIAETVDTWNLHLTGRPMEITCSWAPDKGGKAVVHALSFSAHCNRSIFSGKTQGQWDEMNCNSSYGNTFFVGMGNVSIPMPIELDGAIRADLLVAAENISVNMSNGTSCAGLAEGLRDALDVVLVSSIAQGDRQVACSSKASLAAAYDLLFNRSAESPTGCKCRKSFHDGRVPEYDYCGSRGRCALSDPAACDSVSDHGLCSLADPRNVTVSFKFKQNTVAHSFITAYFRAGFLEEALKYVAVRRVLFKDRVADCGGLVVYGLAAAAGFAAAENAEYVINHGVAVTFGRMVLSIPGHCSTGLIIGIHLGYCKFLGKDILPECLLGLPALWKGFCLFLLTLYIPVLLHGTYDFMLMLPSYTPVSAPLRVLLAVGTTLAGFVYCRFAWLKLSHVCIVHVKELQAAGRISRSQCCCCECDCCSACCVQEDPLLQTVASQAAAAKAAAAAAPPMGLSAGAPKQKPLQPLWPETLNRPGDPAGGSELPDGRICVPEVHEEHPHPSPVPVDCPFCGFSFPDFIRLHVLSGPQPDASGGQQLFPMPVAGGKQVRQWRRFQLMPGASRSSQRRKAPARQRPGRLCFTQAPAMIRTASLGGLVSAQIPSSARVAT